MPGDDALEITASFGRGIVATFKAIRIDKAEKGTTAALTQAWGPSSADGPELLPDKWTLEQGHGKTGTLSMVQMDGLPAAQRGHGRGVPGRCAAGDAARHPRAAVVLLE